MIISCIGLINNIDFSNLKPLFTSNINSNIKASSTYFISSITPLFLLLMIKKDSIKSKEKEEKIPIILTLLSIFLTITQLVIIISVLGINLTNIYQNPDMIVYKKISFLNLLDRVEVMLSLNNFLNGFFILVMCFYTLKETTINIIKTKKEHTILALLGLTFFLLSTTINIKNTIYLNTNIICLVILSIILLRQTIYKYIHH